MQKTIVWRIKGITLKCEVKGDDIALAQMIYNLLDDIKSGDEVVILVAHNGITITESFLRGRAFGYDIGELFDGMFYAG